MLVIIDGPCHTELKTRKKRKYREVKINVTCVSFAKYFLFFCFAFCFQQPFKLNFYFRSGLHYNTALYFILILMCTTNRAQKMKLAKGMSFFSFF